MAHIELKNITKKYGSTTALRDLDLDIADGEFFVLLGETGAGKTTTLRIIAGLEKPTQGQVFIDGEDVADWGAAERDVALVLQQYSLYPRYTVRENLEFPLKSKIRRVAPDEIRERVARAAKTLRIEHLLDRKTDRLSGGVVDRDRVAGQDGVVALIEIGDAVGERRQRQRVGADEGLAIAMADGERRAAAGGD